MLVYPRTVYCFPDKLKTAYTYSHSLEEAEFEQLKVNGFNAVIMKGGMDTNTDYSHFSDHLPWRVKEAAARACQKDMDLFQGLNFIHRVENSIISNNFVVYEDGRAGSMVTPFDPAYWDHLTDLCIALARLSVNHPGTYRITGVWFDFELYQNEKYGEPRLLHRSMGYEDPTFGAYIVDRGLTNWHDPPIEPNRRNERFAWLQNNFLIEDYYSFLETMIQGLAAELRIAVKSVNPDFLIGAYPSPEYEYFNDVFAGWSTRYEPAVVWATEMYNRGGPDQVPKELENSRLPEGYYDLTSVYNKKIYAYYVGGMIPRDYSPVNLDYNMYHVTHKTNGYWFWTTWSLSEPFDNLSETYRVKRFDPNAYVMVECTNAVEYEEAVGYYWTAIRQGNIEINRLISNPSYQTTLVLNPEPVWVIDPEPPPGVQQKIWPKEKTTDIFNFGSAPFIFRRQHTFVIRAQADIPVALKLKTVKIGTYAFPHACTYLILDEKYQTVAHGYVGPEKTETITFNPSKDQQYMICINPDLSGFSILETNVPLMIYQHEKVFFFLRKGTVYFWVPAGVENFTLHGEGFGTAEGFSAVISHSDGTQYTPVASASTKPYQNWFDCHVAVPAGTSGSIWNVEIKDPTDPGQKFEDAAI
ncbi:MAG: hypothetical protein GF384_04470, partial [Elusimicrobia bacterium]|nr:hypothetical protein [Elusimicrobiota bacterium]MBD3412103.1 hypothetical protein [Elusimicrobiota bacterium]